MSKSTIDKQIKKELTPEVIDYGVLSDLGWPGPVSAKKLIETGVASEVLINDAIRRVNEFYVSVNPGAKTRCIDGRHDPELNEGELGPQVPGGAPGAALAYRLGVDKDDLTRGTFLADAEDMIGRFMRMGFAPGGHRDEHSVGKTTAGCGAIDGLDKILATMVDDKLLGDHKRIVRTLLGETAFNRDSYRLVLGSALLVKGHSDDYFRGRETIIDILEKRAKKSIATLKGEHQEGLVVVNLVSGTTLSSNRFSKEFGGMQAFGYDLWRSLQMAGKLLPRPEDAVDRERFIMARVMTTVATLMALTDGSQRLILRIPRNN